MNWERVLQGVFFFWIFDYLVPWIDCYSFGVCAYCHLANEMPDEG